MNHEEQIKAFLEESRRNGFNSFVDEMEQRIQILEQRGYTKDQAIRVLMLYAMQPEEA